MKNLTISSFITAVLILSVTACSPAEQKQEAPAQQAKATYENISVDLFNQTFAEAGPDTIILDVRTQAEVDAGMIPGAIHIDVLEEDFKEKAAALDTTKTYVVYCRSGGRSSNASQIMVNELGFKDVKNLEGGYSAWSN